MAGEKDRWEVYKDKKGEFRWRRKASNGKIVGSSAEAYIHKQTAKMIAERHGMNGNPNNYGASDKWEIYLDKKGEFRWRRKATNGEVVGASSEGYKTKSDCELNANRNGYKSK